jgi:hypothetical protein
VTSAVVCHAFFLFEVRKVFPFRILLSLIALGFGEGFILSYVMVAIFRVTKTNPLVPDAALPQPGKQDENATLKSRQIRRLFWRKG